MILDVRGMSEAERRALELVLGQPLREGDRVTIDVAKAPTCDVPAHGTEENDPESWNVYRGLSDTEIDELEKSFQRLDLSRHPSE